MQGLINRFKIFAKYSIRFEYNWIFDYVHRTHCLSLVTLQFHKNWKMILRWAMTSNSINVILRRQFSRRKRWRACVCVCVCVCATLSLLLLSLLKHFPNNAVPHLFENIVFSYKWMHLFFRNKVDLSLERSVVILRKRQRWKNSFRTKFVVVRDLVKACFAACW